MEFKIIENEQTPPIPNKINLNIDEFIKSHYEKLNAFLDFAKLQKNGVGLAANQCSLNGKRFELRIFALRNLSTNNWSLIINPHIDEFIGIKEDKLEGCLTWKNNNILAKRYRAVKVSYYDMNGRLHIKEMYKGFEGQIWQHEINHLNGVKEIIVDLDYPPPRPIHVGRNELCPCKSGKKYKNCCLLLI